MTKLLAFLVALASALESALGLHRRQRREQEHADAKTRVEEIRRDPVAHFDSKFGGGVRDTQGVSGDAAETDRTKDLQAPGS